MERDVEQIRNEERRKKRRGRCWNDVATRETVSAAEPDAQITVRARRNGSSDDDRFVFIIRGIYKAVPRCHL